MSVSSPSSPISKRVSVLSGNGCQVLGRQGVAPSAGSTGPAPRFPSPLSPPGRTVLSFLLDKNHRMQLIQMALLQMSPFDKDRIKGDALLKLLIQIPPPFIGSML